MNETDFKDIQPYNIKADLLKQSGQLLQTRTSHNVAISVPKPRDLDRIIDEIMIEARKAKDSFFYTWQVFDSKRNKKVWIPPGGTIDLALAIARSWTNCIIDTTCKEEKGEWIFKTTFVDFEKGFTTSRELRQAIPTKPKNNYDMERTKNMAFQIAQSKNQRDAILNGVPRWLKQQAIEVAKQASKNEVAEKGSEILNKALNFFAEWDIAEKDLCVFFDVKTIKDFTQKDIERLRNIATQLQNGDITIEDIKQQVKDEFDKPKEQKEPIPKPESPKEEKSEEVKKRETAELKILQNQILRTPFYIKKQACKNLTWNKPEGDWAPDTIDQCLVFIEEINKIHQEKIRRNK